MASTPTHLKSKQIKTAYKHLKEVRYKLETYYFCGKAKNLTISSESVSCVTCKKCLQLFKEIK